jgi:hypothetical protein
MLGARKLGLNAPDTNKLLSNLYAHVQLSIEQLIQKSPILQKPQATELELANAFPLSFTI